jgi:hypothetical protein
MKLSLIQFNTTPVFPSLKTHALSAVEGSSQERIVFDGQAAHATQLQRGEYKKRREL